MTGKQENLARVLINDIHHQCWISLRGSVHGDATLYIALHQWLEKIHLSLMRSRSCQLTFRLLSINSDFHKCGCYQEQNEKYFLRCLVFRRFLTISFMYVWSHSLWGLYNINWFCLVQCFYMALRGCHPHLPPRLLAVSK